MSETVEEALKQVVELTERNKILNHRLINSLQTIKTLHYSMSLMRRENLILQEKLDIFGTVDSLSLAE